MGEDEIIRQTHQLNGHECEPALGDSEGQGSLACFSPWGLQRVGHVLATEQQQAAKTILVSIKGFVDKENMVHTYNRILLSYRKENNVICYNMDEPWGTS